MRSFTATRFASIDLSSVSDENLLEKLDLVEVEGENIKKMSVKNITLFSSHACTIILNGHSQVRLHPGFGLEIGDQDIPIRNISVVESGVHIHGVARIVLNIEALH